MPEFCVYVCQECDSVYFGVPDTENPADGGGEWLGICASCLDHQFGLSGGGEDAVPQGSRSETAPNG